MPDRIVAGTYLAAAAITRGSIRLTNVNCDHMRPILSKLHEMGAKIKEEENAVSITVDRRLESSKTLTTEPHPGFPTDMQSQFMSLLAVSKGDCELNEMIFESRNLHVEELQKMGANIESAGNKFMIKGVDTLQGARVFARDLRGGAALIIAGLAANGGTIVEDCGHVRRGYEDIARDLNALGANIRYFD